MGDRSILGSGESIWFSTFENLTEDTDIDGVGINILLLVFVSSSFVLYLL